MTDGAPNAWREVTIESITQQTPTVKTFVFRPPQKLEFEAGQHIDVRLVAPDGYEARRSYSISSAPGGDTFELAIEKLDDGEVSPFFHDVAVVGDTIEVSGPFTHYFVWKPSHDGTTLLVGGGSGVAPLVSMLRHRATVTSAPPMTLVYSARTWADVIFRDELLRHEQEQAALTIVFVLTRSSGEVSSTSSHSADVKDSASAASRASRLANYTRRVDAAMLNEVTARMKSRPATTFVCGNNGFVGAVADALVALGVSASGIRTERYGE